MRYEQGHITPWWGDEFKEFEYLNPDHKDENMVFNWRAQGYTNLNLKGTVHSLNANSYAKPFLEYFNFQKSGATIYKMNTGDILPKHKDHYILYKRVFNVTDTSAIWRAIVFMEDWKSGHYFEIENKPIVEWRRGDYVMWNYDVEHMVFNMGTEPRYTLQVTGLRNAY